MVRLPDVLHFLYGALRANLGLKAVALALSVALWWFVAGEGKVQVGFVVPVEIRNVPAGTTITNKVERQVEVRLAGPPSLLNTLKQADVSAALDLSTAKPGNMVFNLDERAVKVPPGIKVQRIYPDVIEVVLERLERRRLPVTVRIDWGAGSRRRITRIEVDPPSLEVEALPEDFTRLKNLVATIPLPETGSAPTTESVRVELRDGHARIVGDPKVRVTVYFRK